MGDCETEDISRSSIASHHSGGGWDSKLFGAVIRKRKRGTKVLVDPDRPTGRPIDERIDFQQAASEGIAQSHHNDSDRWIDVVVDFLDPLSAAPPSPFFRSRLFVIYNRRRVGRLTSLGGKADYVCTHNIDTMRCDTIRDETWKDQGRIRGSGGRVKARNV